MKTLTKNSRDHCRTSTQTHGNLVEIFRQAIRRERMYVICYCFTGDCDVGALLLENGADADAQDVNGRTPMHVAAQCGCTSYLELLITHGADINIRDKLGVTALHQAERNGYTQCVELLLRHAADSVPTPDYIGESTVPPHVLENISKFESAHPESEDDSDIDLGFGLF